MRQTIVFLFCLLSIGALMSQKVDHALGDLLVRMENQNSPDRLISEYQVYQRTQTGLELNQDVSPTMDIYLLKFDHTKIHEYDFLETIRNHPDVLFAQFNHILSLRQTVPDDPQFPNQWQYVNTGQGGGTPGADIDMDLAWDYTTGGLTPNGDSIVVCVIDANFSLSHPDIVDNLWKNHAEIPGNGIDDDLNGYVDDFDGWNVDQESGNVNGFGGHGHSVAGIVGAKGNNGEGVAGVNWNVKLMLVNMNNVTESNALAAYSYPLAFRKKYNESNGAEGAFVVATNASWGLDFGQPEDAPIWCSFYDTLGQYGILNCGATINGNVNVDEQGDLPTGCTSDFLISVTNMDRNDMKVVGAGYGATSIDIGAFGSGVWTVSGPNGYGGFGGTSGATPHVAGAVGLMYSSACPLLMLMTEQKPSEAALLIKESILNSADPNESLDGITLTGGRLNINSSLEYLLDKCSSCPKPFGIKVDSILDVSASATWGVTDSVLTTSLQWRPVGTMQWTTVDSVTSPYKLEGLTACRLYEFVLMSFCADTMKVSDTIVFESEGCCKLPELIDFEIISDTSVMVSWEDIFAGVGYSMAIRNTNEATYDTIMTAENGYILEGLQSCTEYEIRLLTDCDTAMTDFSDPYFFTTFGCGACLDFLYCASKGEDVSEEWIERFSFGPIDNHSGVNDGYAFFSDDPALFFPGLEYIIRIEPGFGFITFEEWIGVWIDLNQDGIFQDSTELLYAPELTDSTVVDTIMIPLDAIEGSTRLRVSMRYENDGPIDPCDQFDFGEVEDYCIEMGPAQIPCGTVDSLKVDGEVIGSSANMIWEMVESSIVFNYRHRKFFDTEWEEPVATLDTFALLEELEECAVYEFQVRTICPFDTSQYSESVTFATFCPTGTDDQIEISGISVFPNPFSQELTLKINPDISGDYEVRLFDLNGRMIESKERSLQYSFEENIRFSEVGRLSPGIYFVSIQNGNRLASYKVVKM